MKKYYIIALILAFCLACKVAYGKEIDIQKIIMIESSGNPHAVSKAGCIGLMGINPKGALADWNKRDNFKEAVYDYHFTNLYNPVINVRIGTWYINIRIPQMLKAYGIEDTVEARLFCYNAGIGTYRKYLKGEIKMPKETKDYLRKYKE